MRKRLVTRTITTTKATVLTVDIATRKTEEVEVLFSGEVSVEGCEKALKKMTQPDGKRYVSVISVDHTTKNYGMPEDKFIELASVLKNND